MKIRTTSIGLPKTYARCKAKVRRAALIGERIPAEWEPRRKPVSVLGGFMLGLLTHEHEKRNPTTEVMSSADRTAVELLKQCTHDPIDRAEHERRMLIHGTR